MLPSPADIKQIAEDFYREHNIVPTSGIAVDYAAVYLVSTSRRQLDEFLFRAIESGTIAPGAAWVVLRWMTHRVFDHAEAGFLAIANGSVPSAEVISRALLEAALNLMYATNEDTDARIFDYLMAYVSQERREVQRWESLAKTMDSFEAGGHLSEISKKQAAINYSEEAANRYAQDAGVTRGPAPWPKLSERFSSLGDDVGYRVLYAAMCSQTHNDAEDLLNFVALATSAQPPELTTAFEQRIARESLYFARFLLYRGTEYLFKAVFGFAKCYRLGDLMATADGNEQEMRRLAYELALADRADSEQFGKSLNATANKTHDPSPGAARVDLE
jgi:hypothetical protein